MIRSPRASATHLVPAHRYHPDDSAVVKVARAATAGQRCAGSICREVLEANVGPLRAVEVMTLAPQAG